MPITIFNFLKEQLYRKNFTLQRRKYTAKIIIEFLFQALPLSLWMFLINAMSAKDNMVDNDPNVCC